MAESNEFVPVLSLNSIDQVQLKRYKTLIEKFVTLYNESPDFIARAPGRVNLIGEHIDYAGFGVLPMAISHDVIIAVSFSNKKSHTNVRISNVDEKYKQKCWNFEGKDKIVEIIVEEGVSEWSNYFKCGYKGILRHLGIENPVGMDCLVDGIVPIGAGLSSSSSFVCCAALVTSLANNAILTKKQITEISIECERFAGMNSGGMDQTASIFSQSGHALYVEFLPTLNATPTKLPTTNPPITFVVANSLVKADKVVTAPIHYNLRVVETKLAAYHLGQLLFGEGCENLKHVYDLYSKSTKVTIDNLKKLSEYVDQVYEKKQEGYTLEELSNMLKLSSTEIHNRFIEKFPVRAEKFHLYKRSKHVFEES
ncbi:6058_t:CDS:2, partial [Scutellospora calospora]